ncbi:MAG TPA: thioesterase family protein [Gemmataceae bacterium]|jgi:acyl-CoA thioester hydrolase|nr:thioesterase family protein [Gemmataceae bacterium]
MSLELLASFPVVIEQAVVWGEMDAYQHVNNVAYFRYFENGRIEYFRRLGWANFDPRAGIGPILASTEATYRKPLTYPDTISIGSRVASMGEDRFIMEHRIVSHRLQAVTTEGRGTIVTFDYATGRKVAVPEDLRRKIAEMEGKAQI